MTCCCRQPSSKIRPRRAECKYAHRPPRPICSGWAALPAQGPCRALEDARLCLFHDASRQRLTEGAESAQGAGILWIRWGQGFLARQPRLDIRGAGNLLGEEQSGHIREVGFELYQSMLEEAVASLKGGDLGGRRISGARRSRSHVGADSRDLCGRPAAQAGPLPQASPDSRSAPISTSLRRTRRFASASCRKRCATARCDGDQGLCRQAALLKVDARPKGAVLAFAATPSPIRKDWST